MPEIHAEIVFKSDGRVEFIGKACFEASRLYERALENARREGEFKIVEDLVKGIIKYGKN